MYIMDMRNGKKTYNVNVVKTVDFHSVILPLVLFVFGILVPVITDDIFVIMFSFVPYYGYLLYNEKNLNVMSIVVNKIVVISSVILGLLFSIVGYNGVIDFLENSGIVLLINVVPSFCVTIYVIISVESRDPSKWASFSPPST